MSDLYSEFLVKKESTAKDAIVKYGLIVLNFANCDMVGHTGSIPAAVQAVYQSIASGPGNCVGSCMLFCDSTDGSGVRVSFCKRGI